MAGKIIAKFLPESSALYKVTLYIDGVKQDEKISKGEIKEFAVTKDCEIYGLFGGIGGIKTSPIRVYANSITEVTFRYKAGTWKNTFEISEVKETPISNLAGTNEDNIERPVFFFDGGVGDKLTVYEDRAIIQHKGVLNFMAMGIHGDKTIYFADLTAIQYKPGGALSGHLQFSVLGGNESRGGVLSAASDENTITFVADKNGEAQKIHDYINNKLRELKAAKNAPIIQAAPAVSAADEIIKFKELLDMGIISQEEFDAKKKQLLGL